jgi:hypothetical protein
MINDRAIKICIALFIFLLLTGLAGCATQPSGSKEESTSSSSKKMEEPVAASPPPVNTEALDPKQLPKLPPPKAMEIHDVVRRVFKNAAQVDTSHNAYYLVGDFNGDYSQDIAVVIKPVESKISEMNEDYPPWMLKDPFQPNLPPQLRKEPLRVNANEDLLAVIHGYGAEGWRNEQATQTYLLKGAVGANLTTQSAKSSLDASHGKKMPKLYGDTIAQVLKGDSGFLYYTGAGYAWYDPSTYAPGNDQRMTHPGIAAR